MKNKCVCNTLLFKILHCDISEIIFKNNLNFKRVITNTPSNSINICSGPQVELVVRVKK